MSLAPASNRGAFLKARLAVKGIQWAARSFGTLTAAGRGLLSSMGASSNCRARGWLQGISFVAARARHGGPLFRLRFRDRGRRPKTLRLRNPRYRATTTAVSEMRLRALADHGRSRIAVRHLASGAVRPRSKCVR